ncbi:MAG: hypothetical protein KJ967_02480 [Elusimicrobia bacterium]|nr:hypothetical protein [Elusimicrobiota bacterium]
MKKISFVSLFFIVILFSYAHAIEIPLEGTGDGTSVGYVDMEKVFTAYPKFITLKQEFETLKKQKDAEVSKKIEEVNLIKKDILTLETQLVQEKIKKQLSEDTAKGTETATLQETQSVAETTTTAETAAQGTIPATTETQPAQETVPAAQSAQSEQLAQSQSQSMASAIEEELVVKREKLLTQQQELEALKIKAEKEIRDFEESKTLSIMGEIYQIIEQLAKEENISIVAEKASILYGQAKTDLTDKVMDRIRGK